jgi:hypothetical protein
MTKRKKGEQRYGAPNAKISGYPLAFSGAQSVTGLVDLASDFRIISAFISCSLGFLHLEHLLKHIIGNAYPCRWPYHQRPFSI